MVLFGTFMALYGTFFCTFGQLHCFVENSLLSQFRHFIGYNYFGTNLACVVFLSSFSMSDGSTSVAVTVECNWPPVIVQYSEVTGRQ